MQQIITILPIPATPPVFLVNVEAVDSSSAMVVSRATPSWVTRLILVVGSIIVRVPSRITLSQPIRLSMVVDSAVAMALAVIVTLYFPKVGIPFIILALLIGFFRVAAGVHFPLDILAGFAIGTLIAMIVHQLFM